MKLKLKKNVRQVQYKILSFVQYMYSHIHSYIQYMYGHLLVTFEPIFNCHSELGR